MHVCRFAWRYSRPPKLLPRRRRALRLPRHLRRRVPRRWRAGLHQHPKARRQIGVRTAWAKVRQIVFAWWVWGIAAITALVYDNWGWAIGTGLMAAFAFLVWPREVPPRVGLDHEFSVDDDEFLTTIAGSTGIPFFEGNAIEILNNGDEFYPAMLEGDRAGAMLGHDRGLHLLGGRHRQAVRGGARRAREGRRRREDSARRGRLIDHRRRDSRNPRARVDASSRGTTPRARTASAASITGRIASRSSSMGASRSPEAPASPITGWGTRRTASTGATFRFAWKARPSCRCRPASRRTGLQTTGEVITGFEFYPAIEEPAGKLSRADDSQLARNRRINRAHVLLPVDRRGAPDDRHREPVFRARPGRDRSARGRQAARREGARHGGGHPQRQLDGAAEQRAALRAAARRQASRSTNTTTRCCTRRRWWSMACGRPWARRTSTAARSRTTKRTTSASAMRQLAKQLEDHLRRRHHRAATW